VIHRFTRRGALFALLACLAAVGLAIPANPASAEVTSLTRCDQPGQPQQITAPGSYRLDADVSALRNCFSISANNVRLILNGHAVTGPGVLGTIGIEVTGSGATILGPGTVSGWNDGVNLLGGATKVRGVTATRNFIGIFIQSTGSDVRGNVTTHNFIGIGVRNPTSGNTIIGNYAHNNIGVDLADGNPNCDNNVWLGNDFGTANMSCIH
jgi:parallel beta-helix repeat protein